MQTSRHHRTAVRAHLLSESRGVTGPADAVADWCRAEPVEFIWFFVEEAVAWAHRRYNADFSFRYDTVEVANLFWHDHQNDTLVVGADVAGQSGSQVAPYAPKERERFLASALSGRQECLGDVHTHLEDEELWAAHLPSPEDIEFHSALWDLWTTDAGDEVPVRPVFQLVQSNRFGDVIAVLPRPDRSVFATFTGQHAEMMKIGAGYRAFQEEVERRLKKIPDGTPHDTFVDVLRKELVTGQKTLKGRADLLLFPNAGYCEPPEDLDEGLT